MSKYIRLSEHIYINLFDASTQAVLDADGLRHRVVELPLCAQEYLHRLWASDGVKSLRSSYMGLCPRTSSVLTGRGRNSCTQCEPQHHLLLLRALSLSSPELSDTKVLRALNTSPPWNLFTFLPSSTTAGNLSGARLQSFQRLSLWTVVTLLVAVKHARTVCQSVTA